MQGDTIFLPHFRVSSEDLANICLTIRICEMVKEHHHCLKRKHSNDNSVYIQLKCRENSDIQPIYLEIHFVPSPNFQFAHFNEND